MTLAGNTVYPYSSIDANFDPPQFRLDSTFNIKSKSCHFFITIKKTPRPYRKNVSFYSSSFHL